MARRVVAQPNQVEQRDKLSPRGFFHGLLEVPDCLVPLEPLHRFEALLIRHSDFSGRFVQAVEVNLDPFEAILHLALQLPHLPFGRSLTLGPLVEQYGYNDTRCAYGDAQDGENYHQHTCSY